MKHYDSGKDDNFPPQTIYDESTMFEKALVDILPKNFKDTADNMMRKVMNVFCHRSKYI